MTRALVPLPSRQQQHETERDVDFQVSIRVRNGRFLNALKRAGYKSVHGFCKQHGLPQQQISKYSTMTLSPLRRSGPTRLAQAVADILNVQVTDLFPPRFLALCLSRVARTEVPMTEDQIGMLLREPPRTPEDVIALDEAAARVSDTLILLPPRQERLLRLRYGMGPREEKTLRQAGEQMDVSPERARQIEAKSLRQLKQPTRGYRLVEPARTLGIGAFIVSVPTRGVTQAEAGVLPAKGARVAARPPPKPVVEPEYVYARPSRKVSFPSPTPQQSAEEPHYIKLLRTPEVGRTEEIKCAIAYHLEEEFVRRGGTRIRPNDDFLSKWEQMGPRAQQLFKYDWFMAHWEQLWTLFPPAPDFYVEGIG